MKISVIGNKLNNNLEEFTVRALEKLGHKVQFLGYNEITGRGYSDFLRMVTTRSNVIRKISSPHWLDAINKAYLLSIGKFRPEIVFSLKGESVLPGMLKYITKEFGIRTALWSPDDPRFFYSLFKPMAPFYDYVFSYSSHGVDLYKEFGIEKVYRLTFGCDNKLHRRESWSNQLIGKALFVGTFTPKRYRILRRLIKNDVKIDIAGKYWRKFLPSNTISDGIYGKDLAEAFQKYMVSINIHNDEYYGPNMRTFEVTGSGGVLLTDKAEDVDKFFRDGEEIFIYGDTKEFSKLFKEIISNNELAMEVARRGYERSHKSYSYEEIMKKFLGILYGH